MSVTISAGGLADMSEFFEKMPDIAEQAAVYATNDVAQRDGLVGIRKEMRRNVAFPSGYLEGDRLRLAKRARRGSIVAEVVGRDRATSLARFAQGQKPSNTRGRKIVLTVAPNKKRTLEKAFLVNLRNGNVGLAVRLKKGEQIHNTTAAVRLADNLFLLYGPSVDQVYRGIAEDRAPQIGANLSRQFLRQFTRLSRG